MDSKWETFGQTLYDIYKSSRFELRKRSCLYDISIHKISPSSQINGVSALKGFKTVFNSHEMFGYLSESALISVAVAPLLHASRDAGSPPISVV